MCTPSLWGKKLLDILSIMSFSFCLFPFDETFRVDYKELIHLIMHHISGLMATYHAKNEYCLLSDMCQGYQVFVSIISQLEDWRYKDMLKLKPNNGP